MTENQPTCNGCDDEIPDETTFVRVSGGVVHHGEPQSDAGGGLFHPSCAAEYIEETWGDDGR